VLSTVVSTTLLLRRQVGYADADGTKDVRDVVQAPGPHLEMVRERKRVNKSVELSGCWKGQWMVCAAIRSDWGSASRSRQLPSQARRLFRCVGVVAGKQGLND